MRAKLVCGDCVKLLSAKDFPYEGEIRLALIDPPYNLSARYDLYEDNKPRADYLLWTRRWLESLMIQLHPTASVWIVINDAFVSEVDIIAKGLGLHKRGHVIWHYTFGVNQTKNFTPSHAHLLYFTRHRTQFTFNPEAIRIPSARQLLYKDKRANSKGRLPNDTWVLFPEQLPEAFDPAGETWLFSRVCGTFKERRKHSPNQLPLPLVERCIKATSNPGDIVADVMFGTGTAAVAALKHNRHFWGCDISPECVKQARERIEAAIAKGEIVLHGPDADRNPTISSDSIGQRAAARTRPRPRSASKPRR